MDWNDCCRYVRTNNITGSEGRVYWVKSDICNEKSAKHYNQEAIKWMKLFFEAHPFIEKVMIVFDD